MECSVMKQWEETTASANRAFHKKEFLNADKLYQCALMIAKNTFTEEFHQNAEKATVAVVVSYLNLTDNHIARADIGSASGVFEAGLTFFLSMSQEKSLSSPQIHALTRGYNRLRMECFGFLKQQCHLLTHIQCTHLSEFANQPMFSPTQIH